MATTTPPNPRSPALHNYEAVCLGALLILVLTLLQRGYGSWCLLPLIVGLLAIYGRLRIGPAILLISLVFQLIYDHQGFGWSAQQLFDLSDLLECSAVLGFVGAHYRLQGLAHGLLPRDPREPRRPRGSTVPMAGPGRAADAGEIIALLSAAIGWAIVAPLVWSSLPDDWNDYWRLPEFIGRLVSLVWVLGIVLIAGTLLLKQLGWQRLSPAEAALFLQDVLWREMRGEQRRAGRWLAWARLRFQRRQDAQPFKETR